MLGHFFMQRIVANWFFCVGFFAAFSAFTILPSVAQHLPRPPADSLPLDPGVRKGRLSNGFAYYIARNAEPPGQVMLSLAVKAGSVLEEPGQLELAHLLEHMGFNATKHFPSAWAYLDSLGLRRGEDVNASTSTDATTYWVIMPSRGGMLTKKNVQLMHDFAQGMLLKPAEIDRERGIVIGECARASNWQQRMRDMYHPWLMRRSQYAKTCGTQEERIKNLREFEHRSLVNFYRDWYRPNLQALIVVGDINVSDVEHQITSAFSDLKNPLKSKQRPEFIVPLTGDSQFLVVTDREMSDIEMQVFMKRRHKTLVTVGDLKDDLLESLYGEMMKQRFDRLKEQYNCPMISASHTDLKIGFPSLTVLHTSVSVTPGEIEPGFKAVVRELERAIRHGFSALELRMAKTACLRQGDFRYPASSSGRVAYYQANFLSGEAASDASVLEQVLRQVLQEITPEDMHRKAKELIRDTDRDILILGPEHSRELLPDENAVLSWINQVQQEDILPYNNVEHAEDSLALAPLRGSGYDVREKRRIFLKDVGVTKIILRNGATVLLKPVNGIGTEKGRIKVYAFAPGGASLYPSQTYFSALCAAEIVGNSGVASWDKFDLKRILSKRSVQGNPFIYPEKIGFSGSAKKQDFEMLMNLMHQYFVAPIKNKVAFDDWKKQRQSIIAYNMLDPQSIFQRVIDSVTATPPAHGALNSRVLETITLEEAYTIYKELFSNAGNFTFIIAGDFHPDTVLALTKKYVGSLPTKEARSRASVSTRGSSKEACTATKATIHAGENSGNASVRLTVEGRYTFTAKNNFQLDACQSLLQSVLANRLRKLEGGTYGVWVHVVYSRVPREWYRFEITFDCPPTIVDKMISAVKEELALIDKTGVTHEAVQNIKLLEWNDIERNKENSDFWLRYLTKQCENNSDLSEVAERTSLVNEVSPTSLHHSFRKYVTGGCFSQFVLSPTP
jgi:zinc protease